MSNHGLEAVERQWPDGLTDVRQIKRSELTPERIHELRRIGETALSGGMTSGSHRDFSHMFSSLRRRRELMKAAGQGCLVGAYHGEDRLVGYGMVVNEVSGSFLERKYKAAAFWLRHHLPGFVGSLIPKSNNVYVCIRGLYVDPAYRSRGESLPGPRLGRRILAELMDSRALRPDQRVAAYVFADAKGTFAMAERLAAQTDGRGCVGPTIKDDYFPVQAPVIQYYFDLGTVSEVGDAARLPMYSTEEVMAVQHLLGSDELSRGGQG